MQYQPIHDVQDVVLSECLQKKNKKHIDYSNQYQENPGQFA